MNELTVLSSLMLALGLGYFFTAMYLLSHPGPQKPPSQTLPGVAVLIAMRNEETYIANCLQSLETQDYPAHLYDVLLIDDSSEDLSVETALPVIERNNNFHLIKVTQEKDGLRGKMNALSQAIQITDREIILITDADCIVPPSWIRTHVSYFSKDTGMVGGLTMLEPPDKAKPLNYRPFLFGRLQALDWFFLQSMAAATSNAGMPVTILGNNFGFRLAAYKETGGFKSLGFSLTEDYALMRAIEKTGRWKIRHTLDSDNMIFSYPLPGIGKFINQRMRWLSGGKSARLWGYFMMGLSFISSIFILLTFLLGEYNYAAGLGIGLIIGMDYLIISRGLRKMQMPRLKRYFTLYELFHFIYIIIVGLLFFIPQKTVWKGRKL